MTEITFRSSMGVEYVSHMGDDKRIAQAARVSTGNDDSDRPYEGLVRRLWADKHFSPFEHCTLTVKATVPIFVAREWMRSRTQSYSEISGRYTEMRPVFYVPHEDRPLVQTGKAMDYRREPGSGTQEALTSDLHERIATGAWGNYQVMLDHGIAREVARNVLPVSLFTEFYATANLRNWLAFIDLRTDPTALWEIRDAAHQVEAIVKDHWPVAWYAFAEK